MFKKHNAKQLDKWSIYGTRDQIAKWVMYLVIKGSQVQIIK